jgi:hypothetical protein
VVDLARAEQDLVHVRARVAGDDRIRQHGAEVPIDEALDLLG